MLSLQEKLPYIYMVHLKSIWKTYINIWLRTVKVEEK